MASSSTLDDTLQAEFCPPLDSSLISMLLGELKLDDAQNRVQPSAHQISALRVTLSKLAAQAESEGFGAGNESDTADHDQFPMSSPTTTMSTTSTDFTDTSSSYSSWDSQDDHGAFVNRVDILRDAFPNVPMTTLVQALQIQEMSGDDNDEDVVDVIMRLQEEESSRERNEHGGPSELQWEAAKGQGKGKAGQRSRQPVDRTITLGSVPAQLSTRSRARRQPPSAPTSMPTPTPEPWTQLLSIAERLASLLPPVPHTHFLSYLHQGSSRYDAIVACLRDLVKQRESRTPSSPNSTPIAFGRSSATCSNGAVMLSDFIELSCAPAHLAELALSAAEGRDDDAFSIIALLKDLKNEETERLAARARRPSNANGGSSGPGLVSAGGHPTSTLFPVASQWKAGPSSRVPDGSHASDAVRSSAVLRCSPGGPCASKPPGHRHHRQASGSMADSERRVEELGQTHRMSLQSAMNARKLGGVGGKRYGAEVAAFYHEEARRCRDMIRGEKLDNARRLVEGNRHDSGDPNTIDLHGTRVSEAITIVKEILAREGASASKPLHFVTGRGIHSAGGVPVLGPAVRGALIKDGWDVVESRGGTLSVRGRVSR